jgi:hypothetical protein
MAPTVMKAGYEPLPLADDAEAAQPACCAERGAACRVGRIRRAVGCLLVAVLVVLLGARTFCPELSRGRHSHRGPHGWPHGPHDGPGDDLDDFRDAAKSIAASELEAAMGPVARDRRRLFQVVKGEPRPY